LFNLLLLINLYLIVFLKEISKIFNVFFEWFAVETVKCAVVSLPVNFKLHFHDKGRYSFNK